MITKKIYHSKRHSFRGKRGVILSLFCLCTVITSVAQSVNEDDEIELFSLAENSKYLSLQNTLQAMTDSVQIILDLEHLPEAGSNLVNNLNVRDMDVRDLLRGFGREYDLNIIVDNDINQLVTMRLSNIPVMEAVVHICREYGLKILQNSQVFRISRYQPPVEIPEPQIPDLRITDNDLITLDLSGDDLELVVRMLSQLTGKNMMVRNGVSGKLSGYLQNVPFRTGIETILNNNGFSLRENDGILIVDRAGRMLSQGSSGEGQHFWVNVDQEGISMDVDDARIQDLIREIAYQKDVNLVTYNLPEGIITAKTKDLSLEQTFSYLFRGTNVTYRREGDIYVIGDKSTSGIATNELIRLRHLRADVALGLIPESVVRGATIQLVKEQNGLMVIGTNDIILELRNFINEIDYPTPQILIEALVVDLQSSDLFELGATLGYRTKPDSNFDEGSFATFGTEDSQGRATGGVFVQGHGEAANRLFERDGNLFGIKNLGVLPSDFYFRIRALEQEGVMNVRSRPQISTLNGHTASIEIGTKQYFILRSSTPLTSPQSVVLQESERFETIEANVSLKITPWVSASGEVTTEIRPEFNTPVGTFSPDVPPTINSRVLDSTVRLKDGETIILGGLIQEAETANYNKIPIIGSIPLLGRLFSNRSISKTKSELVIFITPYVFYGDESDSRNWNLLREEMEIDTKR